MTLHYDEFRKKSSLDFQRNYYKVTKDHFTIFVSSKLKWSILDNFKVSSINKNIKFIYDIQKPMYLMSYSSWCVPSNGEIEALNKLVNKHSSWMDFVLIMWDTKNDARKFSKKFHRKVKVLYVNELNNTKSKAISILKHKFGVPVSLTVSSDKVILNIRKNTQIHFSVDKEIALKACYDDILADIQLLKKYEDF